MILGQRAVTRIRYAAPTVGTDGRASAGAATSSTVYASVQPASGRQLEKLPEGLRQTVEMIAYTETPELRTADQVAGVPADRVVCAGETYQVEHVALWDSYSPIPHYEAALSRVAESGGAP